MTAAWTARMKSSFPIVCLWCVLLVALPAQAAMRIGVIDFRDASGSGLNAAALRALTATLVEELYKTRCFEIVERERIDEIARRKSLILQGFLPQSQAADIGQELEARALVTGVVTGWSVVRTPGMGNDRAVGQVALDVRVADAQTGRELFRVAAGGTADTLSANNLFRKATQRQGENDLILAAAAFLATREAAIRIGTHPTLVKPLSVLSFSPSGDRDFVVVDAGSTSGTIRRGDRLVVCREGEPIRNDKNDIIGISTQRVALLEVVVLLPRSSKCAILEGRREDIRPGDTVIFATGESSAPAGKR